MVRTENPESLLAHDEQQEHCGKGKEARNLAQGMKDALLFAAEADDVDGIIRVQRVPGGERKGIRNGHESQRRKGRSPAAGAFCRGRVRCHPADYRGAPAAAHGQTACIRRRASMPGHGLQKLQQFGRHCIIGLAQQGPGRLDVAETVEPAKGRQRQVVIPDLDLR